MTQPMQFPVSVKEHPTVALMGLRVRTTMEKASIDCQNLWAAFVPRLHEVLGQSPETFTGALYGVSVMIDESGTFDYWAAGPAGQGVPLPQDMQTISLRGGPYACCEVPSLQHITAAYSTLYQDWPTSQTAYALNNTAPCFERYDERYLKTGAFDLYVPVIKK